MRSIGVRPDAQTLPHLVKDERAAESPGVDDLHVRARQSRSGADRIEHSADGGRQTGELQVGDLGAVLVPAAGLTQVDAYIVTNYPRSVK
jgi:hypothetical protein